MLVYSIMPLKRERSNAVFTLPYDWHLRNKMVVYIHHSATSFSVYECTGKATTSDRNIRYTPNVYFTMKDSDNVVLEPLFQGDGGEISKFLFKGILISDTLLDLVLQFLALLFVFLLLKCNFLHELNIARRFAPFSQT